MDLASPCFALGSSLTLLTLCLHPGPTPAPPDLTTGFGSLSLTGEGKAGRRHSSCCSGWYHVQSSSEPWPAPPTSRVPQEGRGRAGLIPQAGNSVYGVRSVEIPETTGGQEIYNSDSPGVGPSKKLLRQESLVHLATADSGGAVTHQKATF